MKAPAAPLGHLRALGWDELAAHMHFLAPTPPGLVVMLSPLGAWVEVGIGSAEALFCRAHYANPPSQDRPAQPPRDELMAEAFYRFGRLQSFARMVLASPAIAAHIAALLGCHDPHTLAEAQHYARMLLARQAAREALTDLEKTAK